MVESETYETKKKDSWFNLSPSPGSHLLVFLPFQQQKEIHCSLVGRLFRKKKKCRQANVFTANSPTSLLSITVYSSPPASHLTGSEKHRPTAREKASWQQTQASPDSAEQLCLIKSLVSGKERRGKKTQSTSRQFSTKERGSGGQGGVNDGEILLKSSNDRGQFLLTRRKRYNESTDWWILRFKSWLIGSKRILRRLLRSVARRQVLSSVGKYRISEVKPKEQFSCILAISGRHSTQSHRKACWWSQLGLFFNFRYNK